MKNDNKIGQLPSDVAVEVQVTNLINLYHNYSNEKLKNLLEEEKKSVEFVVNRQKINAQYYRQNDNEGMAKFSENESAKCKAVYKEFEKYVTNELLIRA